MIIFPRKNHTQQKQVLVKRSNYHVIVLVKQTSKEEQDHNKGNLMLECKCEGHETTGFFSRGIEELTLPPNPRWSTHTRVQLPCFTKEQVITKNALSPSPERRASHRVQCSCLGAPTNTKSSPRTSRSPRPSRCHQTPRVTSSKTFT